MSSDDAQESLEARIGRLETIEEIKLLKARYFRYLDLHRWDALRDLFTDDARFDIAESTSHPATADDFITSVGRHLSTAMSVHHGHMPEIVVEDEEHASGIWAMYDLVEPGADATFPVLTGFGHYTEDYRRVDGRWRIAALRLTRLRRSVDGTVIDGAEISAPRPFHDPAGL